MTNDEAKIALVTGGTGTVGQAVLKQLVAQGWMCHFTYCTNDLRATELEASLAIAGWRVDFRRFSDGSLPDVDPRAIVHCAGVNISSELGAEVSESDWDQTFDVNVRSMLLICRKYIPRMVEAGGGQIVSINSIYGLKASERNLPYTASKHALSGLTKTIALEYASSGIACNEICPGPIDSEMMNRIAQRKSQVLGITPQDYLSEVAGAIPAHRLADPIEIARLVTFLVSSEAPYINGESLRIDGAILA